MQWLPPQYRILYSQELYDIEFVSDKLQNYLNSGSLFCSLENGEGDFVAIITGLEKEGDKLKFLVLETKPNIFENKNIHISSYFVDILIDIEDMIVSNSLILRRIHEQN